AVATADGIAMAYRAGAEISDMEFVQFHPTALHLKDAPHFLLSEALRGEGAVLRNAQLSRFMPKYHEAGELAPRDVVARAIAHELEVSRLKDPVVYLDLTHRKAEYIMGRFPRICDTCLVPHKLLNFTYQRFRIIGFVVHRSTRWTISFSGWPHSKFVTHGLASPSAKNHALQQRVAGQSISAVNARASHFSRRVKPRQAGF